MNDRPRGDERRSAPERHDDLRLLSDRLAALHAALLDGERHAYEATYGPTKPAELLWLLIDDARALRDRRHASAGDRVGHPGSA